MIKIGFDVSPLRSGHAVRGIGYYTKNLSEALKEITRKPEYKEVNVEFLNTQLTINNQQFDILHHPYFDLFFSTLSLRKKQKTIVTIHDVIPLVYPDKFPPGLRGKIKFLIQKFSLQSVNAVLTDSQHSASDIFRYLGYPREKIQVVYLAPGFSFKPLGMSLREKTVLRQKYHLPDKFVLYVGDINYNKNVPGLLGAMSRLEKSVSLVLVGKAFEDNNLEEVKEIRELIGKLDLEGRVVILGWLPEDDLVAIYNLATVYCQPSFYEGFGLPVLEAMASGCPVIASCASSLPEISGEAALLVNPEDEEEMAAKIKDVFSDKKLHQELVRLGKENVRRFSWEKTALETLKVYEKVAKEK